MSYEWQGKVVVVTGAANWIACMAHLALQERAKHVVIIDECKTRGEALENKLNAEYGTGAAKYYKCDVTIDEQLSAVFDCVMRAYGALDVVVNNAAIMSDSPDAHKKTNVTALVTSTLKALELMRVDEGGKGGTIINISSIAGLSQPNAVPIYFAIKSAVIQFSNCIGQEEYFKRTGVRVLTMCFGPTCMNFDLPQNVGSTDKKVSGEAVHSTSQKIQRLESAAKGVIDAYKTGKSGSTWIATQDLPVQEITDIITKEDQITGEPK